MSACGEARWGLAEALRGRKMPFARFAAFFLEVPQFLRHENRRAPENKG